MATKAREDISLLSPSTKKSATETRLRAAVLVLAIAGSLGLLYWQVANIALLFAFLALAVCFGAIVFFLKPQRGGTDEDMAEIADWAVTRMVADQSDIGLAITDRAGRLVCANELFIKWFNGPAVPPELPLEAGGNELLSTAGRDAWRDGRGYAEGLKRGVAEYSAKVVRAGQGDEYLLWQFKPQIAADILDDTIRMVGGATGRAISEAGLLAAVIGGEGRIRASNQAFAMRATGRSEANISGRNFINFLRSDDKGTIFFEREGQHGTPVRLFHIPLERNKEKSPALILLIDDDGGMMERGKALEQVESMLSLLPLGLALTDRDGRFLFLNEAFGKTAGLREGEQPLYPGDLMIKDDKSAVADAVRRYASGQPMSGDLAVRLRAGGEDPVALGIAGVRGLGDAAVLLSIKDNSEETKLKSQVAQATKMQAVGQLAGGVAHDFNNILTAIIGHCDLMLLRHAPGDSDYDDIQQVRNNSNRAAGLTRQLLAFSRQQTLRPQVLQLPDVVADVSNLLKRLLDDNIELEVKHGRNLGLVRADPGQLEQVIINLGVNARDAINAKSNKGGKISVTTEAVTASDVRALKSDILPVGDYTALIIADTGKGIPPDVIGKIFEPFFTTKEVGKGTGLGLSTVYGIVKQSGGYIFADSAPGAGATFSIYFPVHTLSGEEATRAARPAKAAVTKELWGSGHILLVEDEDMVRAVAERALTRQGYTVVTASDGEEGLDYLNAQADSDEKFDIIVSDVVMPNMDGPAMAKQAREKYPELPILFMSGYAEEQLRKSIDLDNVAFLPKPFSVAQIAEAVGNILAEHAK
ncbi:response regulator [Parasphingorhabdus halotolerans]|uniref:histidine kinase n=1 Tax=Parasphingorhabdus halotolerans TaxID=2725558 RepID=A0A6H2DSC7_9SPHN|nr:response regulator [Parasphingorhabdus halotolerans]QJB70566.1 response regulator [Parasphingorhabdus halotolerans]